MAFGLGSITLKVVVQFIWPITKNEKGILIVKTNVFVFHRFIFITLTFLVSLTLSLNSASAEFAPQLTAHAHPDTQGNWTSDTITPFERPEDLGNKRVYSQVEAEELESVRTDKLEERARQQEIFMIPSL